VLPIELAALGAVTPRTAADQVGPVTATTSAPRAYMVQCVARPAAVSAERAPTAEDRLPESLLGLSLGAQAGLIDVMVNHAGQSRCPKLLAEPAQLRAAMSHTSLAANTNRTQLTRTALI